MVIERLPRVSSRRGRNSKEPASKEPASKEEAASGAAAEGSRPVGRAGTEAELWGWLQRVGLGHHGLALMKAGAASVDDLKLGKVR